MNPIRPITERCPICPCDPGIRCRAFSNPVACLIAEQPGGSDRVRAMSGQPILPSEPPPDAMAQARAKAGEVAAVIRDRRAELRARRMEAMGSGVGLLVLGCDYRGPKTAETTCACNVCFAGISPNPRDHRRASIDHCILCVTTTYPSP